MKIKLTKYREGRGILDIVYYKDEKGVLYRLRHVERDGVPPVGLTESLHRLMCLSSYAPWTIEGELVAEDDSGKVKVEMLGDFYILEKNAKMIKFKDIREIWRDSGFRF